MKASLPFDDESRADLIAYLDGEVDEQQARFWEVRLNTDPALRAEAEALRKAWELLDYLPAPAVSTAFTSRTLDRLSAIPLEPKSASGAARRWALRGTWAAALLTAATLGFTLVRQPNPPPTPTVTAKHLDDEPEFVRALPVLENLHEYEYVETLAFLMDLDQADLFGDER